MARAFVRRGVRVGQNYIHTLVELLVTDYRLFQPDATRLQAASLAHDLLLEWNDTTRRWAEEGGYEGAAYEEMCRLAELNAQPFTPEAKPAPEAWPQPLYRIKR